MAYTDITTPWFNIDSYCRGIFRTWDDATTVNVILESKVIVPGISNHNWTMELRRQVTSMVWETVGTRKGYVTPTSQSLRTFTDVGKKNTRMRVRITFDNGQVVHSGIWVR